ncbi:MAG: DMT family transporter [Trueperaceae bacterium]|nr:DMT family transporter [Trueperaceae bacterium]
MPPTRLLTGFLLMMGAMILLPVMDGFAKHLQTRYPVAQVVWARYLFHLLVMLPLVLARFGPRALWPERVGVQVFRGSLLLGATTLFFSSIARMPLADTLALFFVSPLVVTVLATLVLGEPVGWRRAAAVAVGFAGVLVILRPGTGVFEWTALLAVGAGTVHGLYMLTTRKLAGSAPPLVTLAYTALVGAIVMSAIVGFVWVPPTPGDFGLMLLLGLLAAAGHFLIIKAFDHAPAAWLAPVGYSEIVMSTLVGYVAFGDFPDGWTWIGIAIIVASGLYVSVRERRIYRAHRPGA